jgi:hypothetical protein
VTPLTAPEDSPPQSADRTQRYAASVPREPAVKSMLTTLMLGAICLASARPACADEAFPVPPAGLRAGTPGIGPEFAYRFGP